MDEQAIPYPTMWNLPEEDSITAMFQTKNRQEDYLRHI